MIPIMRPWFDGAETLAVTAAIESGWVAQGPRVEEFEGAVAAHVGAEQGVAVSSATTGLHLVLHALGVRSGDEVITPSLSFIASANAPRYVGATPVFVDVDPTTLNVTKESIEARITDRTRAVIVVHQLGMPADLKPIQKLCSARGIPLIEDAACAIGSTYDGSDIGSHSDYVVFSFHPRKVITTGEGGMIMTNNDVDARRLRALRQHAMSVSAFDRHVGQEIVFEEYPETGFNFRLTDIQAAMGLAQLAKLDRIVKQRRYLAELYSARLSGIDGLTVPQDPDYGFTNFQSYCLRLDDRFPLGRNDLMRTLDSAGISSRRGVMAAHRERAFSDLRAVDLPNTEWLADNTILLPLFHEMTDEQVDQVCLSVTSASL